MRCKDIIFVGKNEGVMKGDNQPSTNKSEKKKSVFVGGGPAFRPLGISTRSPVRSKNTQSIHLEDEAETFELTQQLDQ